ncbi:hypothetical protein U8P80_24130 [Rhizobium beringeri]|jgi:hypothetical protein|nr:MULTISPECIES: hypothetical protein [Rhizobium]WSG76537.1 hypothetical protein U8P80_24130 [Rhizobium beringeri]WSG91340.1 hypothetical protein U8P73_23915 [Rhizobium beringeri]WSH16732.1 hypothetical protein U8P74_24130 [Rhizobium beringeri]WSH29456.1 hypothetical protein U8P75_24155 [Rhizobium beringeri]WSH53551.1 hypothetical protein U8Q06_24075 [Rhizobium beringeri]
MLALLRRQRLFKEAQNARIPSSVRILLEHDAEKCERFSDGVML